MPFSPWRAAFYFLPTGVAGVPQSRYAGNTQYRRRGFTMGDATNCEKLADVFNRASQED
jgi:hypothetical protein